MARLSKEQLTDRTRYQFKAKEVYIEELDGEVEIKALSVRERDALPELHDENGKKQMSSVAYLAELFASAVSDPEVTAEEAKGFLGDLPGTACDRVIEEFAELLGIDTKGNQSAAVRRDFRPSND